MKIAVEKVSPVCKLGRGKECCRYLLLGNGWECARGTSMEHQLDMRVGTGSMNAQGADSPPQPPPSSNP